MEWSRRTRRKPLAGSGARRGRARALRQDGDWLVQAPACRPGKPSQKEGNQPVKLGELGGREAQCQPWLSEVRGWSLSLSRPQISCLHNEGLGGIVLSHLGFCHLKKVALLLP